MGYSFNEDRRKQELVRELMVECTSFVETGTALGGTVREVAVWFPEKPIFTCEIVPWLFEKTKKNLERFLNIQIFQDRSERFLGELDEKQLGERPFFFLDAHPQGDIDYSYQYYPLAEELEIVLQTPGIIMIDNFEVPFRKDYPYTFKLKDFLPVFKKHLKSSAKIFYPNYGTEEARRKRIVGYIIIFNLGGVSVETALLQSSGIILRGSLLTHKFWLCLKIIFEKFKKWLKN